MPDFALAWRLLRRDARAGELRVLLAALVLAVAAVASVGLFTDRVRASLVGQANDLLGADLMISADRPLPETFAQEALRRGLASSQSVRFPSMVQAVGSAAPPVLAELKAVDERFPLRSEILVMDEAHPEGVAIRTVPAAGETWIDSRLSRRLGVAIGGSIAVGEMQLRVTQILFKEPEASTGFLALGPRLLINQADLAATALLAPGNRATYRLLVAGREVDGFQAWAAARISGGQRIETIRDLRPEIRQTLERAERFLGIASLVAVMLAAVAVALAAGRYLRRHLDASAVMRCLGAPQRQVLRLYLAQFLLLGAAGSALGAALGYAGQAALAALLAFVASGGLPAPSWVPALQAFSVGMVLLIGFALPPLVALAKVPPLRVLRRDVGVPRAGGFIAYLLGLATIAALVIWQAGNATTGLIVFLVMLALVAVCIVSVCLLLVALRGIPTRGYNWRYGLANLRRRPLAVSLQVSALGLGLMALLLLTLVRGDLLRGWKATLPPDAPNTFLINIQPDQRAELAPFLVARGVAKPAFYPMVRGRLVERNGKPVSTRDYADDRAQRLVDREFNLSYLDSLPPANEVVAGAWWKRGARGLNQGMSLEEGIAQTLGIAVGDHLVFDIAGQRVATVVTSLRKVRWDSFRVNFFAVFAPGALDDMPTSYITSFRSPSDARALAGDLVANFPNVLLIDVSEVLAQVQNVMDQIARAVQFVFLFTLAGGLLVLQAAIASTQDERRHDAAVLRTLGAHRRQLASAQLMEFSVMGALAGVLAAAFASLAAWLLATEVLSIPYAFDPWVWAIGIGGAMAVVSLAGWLGTRRVLDTPPQSVLREI